MSEGLRRYIVTVEFDVQAASEQDAERAVYRGMETGANDITEIEGTAIVEIEGVET